MDPRRSCISAIVLVAMLLTPIHAYAAVPPRVIELSDLAAKPFEVAISSKQLTLIHFETGDVSMVAVGDPAIVNVTVKGPDVLLKALTSSGSTNAFISESETANWLLLLLLSCSHGCRSVCRGKATPLS